MAIRQAHDIPTPILLLHSGPPDPSGMTREEIIAELCERIPLVATPALQVVLNVCRDHSCTTLDGVA